MSQYLNSCKQLLSGLLPLNLKPSAYAPHFLKKLVESERVAGGLFKGMRYHGEAVCGASAPKILGVYEAELAPYFLRLSSISFDRIIDVGAAEGYYAVGCAMLWPKTKVIAFEGSEHGRELLKRMVEINGVDSRVEIRGNCDCVELQDSLMAECKSLVIMDVEGQERLLLDPVKVHGLSDAHIIVEIHDCYDKEVGRLLQSRLESTHRVEEVWTRPRRYGDFHRPHAVGFRLWIFTYLKQYANEFRPGPMRWFCCTPRSFK